MKLTISRRLALGAAIPAALIVIIVAGTWVASTQLKAMQDQSRVLARAEAAAVSATNAGPKLYQIIASAMINGNVAGSQREWSEAMADTHELSDSIEKLVTAPADRDSSKAGVAEIERLTKVFESELPPILAKGADAAGDLQAIDAKMSEIVASIGEKYTQIRRNAEAAAKIADEQFASMVSLCETLSAIVGVLALICALGAAIVINRSITGPLLKLDAAMRRLAGGEFSIAVPELKRKDEIGQMARTVEVFQQNAVEKVRLEEAQRGEESARMRRANAVDEMIRGFESVINDIVETVSNSAGELRLAAQSLTSTAEETSSQSNAVANASSEASANVQTVAAAANELSASVREVSRQVEDSAKVAQTAMREATASAQTVKELSVAAQKIGQIVDLISTVAAQTNLLALNATIEAARAGEAGRGFAVVAAEVKGLADQTAKATAQIASQVDEIQGSTGRAVGAISTISDTIEKMTAISNTIATSVDEQATTTQEIARSAQMASLGTSEVTSNISGVTRAADETSSSASHVFEASTKLSRQADLLRERVGRFIADVRAA